MTNTTEYLQRQLVDMIELAKSTGTNAVEFVQAQAPDLVRQIIVWEIVSDVALILMCITIMLVLYKLTSKGVKNDWESLPFIIGFGDIVIGVASFATLIMSAGGLIKAVFAPKLFLIEYVAQLFKNHS